MVSELAIFATRAPWGTRWSCRSERSAAGSEATTFAATDSPPRNSTLISDLVYRVHHVGRRHDLAVCRDEPAGAGLGELLLTARAHLATSRPDHDDGRRDLLEDFAEVLGLSTDGHRNGQHNQDRERDRSAH